MIFENSDSCVARLGQGFATVLSEIRGGTFPKTVLLEGRDKESRYMAALVCACLLMCESEEDKRPCMKCPQCKKVLSEHHTDVTILSCTGGKVRVDDIREVRRDAFASPFEKDFKVFILQEAQGLGAGSQNALLKILEEPPEHVYFILTAPDSGMLLETVDSRCTKYSLGSATYEDVCRSVCEVCGSDDKADISRMAAAILYLDGFEISEKNIATLRLALDICDKYYGDGVFPYSLLPSKKDDNDTLLLVLRTLALCALEVCRCKKGADMKNGILSKTALESAVMKMPLRTAFSRYEFFCNMEERLLLNANFGAVMAAVRTELQGI